MTKLLSRFAFYWNEQRGRCALMITEACRMHGGQMTERSAGGRQRPSDATWDHIYPKPRTPEQEPIQVLACAACNNKRGNAPARAEYVARGLVLFEEWRAGEADRNRPGVKRRRRQVQQIQRRAVRAMQQGDDTLAEAVRKKRPFCLIGSKAHQIALGMRQANSAKDKRHIERHPITATSLTTEKAAAILAALRGDKPPERK